MRYSRRMIDLGWNQMAYSDRSGFVPGLAPMRITGEHRNHLIAQGECTGLKLHLPWRLRQASQCSRVRPAVGDWILAAKQTDDIGWAHAVFPRQTVIKRLLLGRGNIEQVICANVQVALILFAVDRKLRTRQLQLHAALAFDAGVSPVIVLTKVDLKGCIRSHIRRVHAVLPGIPVVALDARHGSAQALLAPWLQSGHTAIMLGASGVGKSTLLNTLACRRLRAVGTVRGTEKRGRHVTADRRLVPLQGRQGCVIDIPGLHTLLLPRAQVGAWDCFDDIRALATSCKFRNCRHGREPGCALRKALGSGDLHQDRWLAYRSRAEEGKATHLGQRGPRSGRRRGRKL